MEVNGRNYLWPDVFLQNSMDVLIILDRDPNDNKVSKVKAFNFDHNTEQYSISWEKSYSELGSTFG